MRKTTTPGRCERKTLNEVLAAELDCLRPGNGLYSGSAEKDHSTLLMPPSYPDKDGKCPDDLKRIYKLIGGWSTARRDAAVARNDRCNPQSPPGDASQAPLSALCLSGGGIRSATFNLGVLQALARIGLLGKFDYLSSVSGGGYIASWLRAWMHRAGVDTVVNELKSGANAFAPLSPEPKPVSNLRDYSNYLTPVVGLFSGDTWSAAATILRNLLLNWLMLLPVLGAVIGVPLLFLLFIRTPDITDRFSNALMVSAFVTEGIASLLVYSMRRFAKSATFSQGHFILTCVLPICLAAGALSGAALGSHLPGADLPSVAWYKIWGCCAIWCIGVPVAGWFVVEVIARLVKPAQKWTTGTEKDTTPPSEQQFEENVRSVAPWTELGALIFSGAVGMCLLVGLVQWWFSFLFNHPALYTVFALPILLGVYLISRVIFIGVASLSDERGEETTGVKDPGGDAPIRNRIYGNDSDREWWSRLSGWLLLVIVSWTVVTGVCLLGCYLPDDVAGLIRLIQGYKSDSGESDPLAIVVKWVIGALGGASGLIAALSGSDPKTPASADAPANPAPKSTARLLAIAGPLFVVCLIMTLSWSVKGIAASIISASALMDLFPVADRSDPFKFDFDLPGNQQALPWPIPLAFLAILLSLAFLGLRASRIANVNRFSLHGMYRNRLVRAYLGASNCAADGKDHRIPDPFTGFALSDNFPLHSLCDPPNVKEHKPAVERHGGSEPTCGCTRPDVERRPEICKAQRPLSIINTTLNLVNGEKLAWQQRKAASFSMTPLFCGNWLEGYRSSRKYGGPDGITVGTAITISGAAANPNMGYCSSPVLGFLMAMFNLRLGAWLGNTNVEGDDTYDHPGPRQALLCLLAEMFGLTNSHSRYVNLSDGGHFDNLGLYEAVLRRCRYVLVSDAGRDQDFAFEDLGNSIRKIRIDFGIDIEFDTIRIFPNTSAAQGLCCGLGRICYSRVDGTPQKDDGLLIYIKPTLRGGAQIPYDIYSYSRYCQEFPHESTADQWFSESQFESYRALGLHIASQLTNRLTTMLENESSKPEPQSLPAATLFEYFYAAVGQYVATDGGRQEPAAEETVTRFAALSITLPRPIPPKVVAY